MFRKQLGYFFVRARLGRALTKFIHPRIHADIPHPLSFVSGPLSCALCRLAWAYTITTMRPESFMDRSVIKISEQTDEKYGLEMTATAKRQMDAIMTKASPEEREEFQKALDTILTKPRVPRV